MMELETERLRLCRWEEKHFEPYAAYYADEDMAQWVGGLMGRERAWRHLATVIGHWTLRGFGYWAVEEKKTGMFTGCVGLWFSEGWPEIELGYWITREMQGKGYATESSARCRDYGFEALGLDTLVSYVHPENEPSKRVVERLGGKYEKTIELLDLGPHQVYRYLKPGDTPPSATPLDLGHL